MAGLAAGFSKERLLSGERLPAAIAVSEDIREADAGHGLARRVDQGGETAGISEVALHVRAQLGKPIHARLFVWNVPQRLTASLQRAVGAGVFKLIGQHASHCVSVLAAESCRPVLFEFDQRGRGFWLILGAIGYERGRHKCERQQNGKKGEAIGPQKAGRLQQRFKPPSRRPRKTKVPRRPFPNRRRPALQ